MTSSFALLPLLLACVVTFEYFLSFSGSRDETRPSAQWVCPPDPPTHRFRCLTWHLIMFACNTKTGEWTVQRQVFWGLFLHCRCYGHTWLNGHIVCCLNRRTDVSWRPQDATVTRITHFNLRRIESLKLWRSSNFPDFNSIKHSHYSKEPQDDFPEQPRISLLSSSQMLLMKNKRTTRKSGDTVTICLV